MKGKIYVLILIALLSVTSIVGFSQIYQNYTYVSGGTWQALKANKGLTLPTYSVKPTAITDVVPLNTGVNPNGTLIFVNADSSVYVWEGNSFVKVSQSSDYITVKSFGAVGNGVADDYNSFQSAVTYCAMSGQTLHVTNGRYFLGSTVEIPDNYSIRIDGDSSIITSTANIAIRRSSHDYTSITGLHFTNCKNGLVLEAGTTDALSDRDYQIDKCNFDSCTGAGLMLLGMQDGTIINSQFQHSDTGLYISSSFNISLASSQFHNNTTVGVWLDAQGSAYGAGLMIENSLFIGNPIGIRISRGDYFSVNNCMVDYNDLGILVEGQDGGNIVGSFISSRSASPAIKITNKDGESSVGIKIKSNTIQVYGFPDDPNLPYNASCIEIDNSFQGLIEGNHIIFYSEHGIDIGANVTETRISNNYFAERPTLDKDAIGYVTDVSSVVFDGNTFSNTNNSGILESDNSFTKMNNLVANNSTIAVVKSPLDASLNYGTGTLHGKNTYIIADTTMLLTGGAASNIFATNGGIFSVNSGGGIFLNKNTTIQPSNGDSMQLVMNGVESYFRDKRTNKIGLYYYDNYTSQLAPNSLITKGYIDSINALRVATINNNIDSIITKVSTLNYTQSINGIKSFIGSAVGMYPTSTLDISTPLTSIGGSTLSINTTNTYVNKPIDIQPSADSFVFTFTPSLASFQDKRARKYGIQYLGNYGSGFNSRSLVDKGYVDSITALYVPLTSYAAADGATKGIASFNASDFDASSGNISIDYTNGTSASSSNKGFLTSTDFNTFNNKQSRNSFSSGSIIFRGSANLSEDNSFLSYDSTNHRVGFGNGAPQVPVHVGTAGIATALLPSAQIIASSNSSNGTSGVVANATATTAPFFQGVRSRGTLASPSAAASGDRTLSISAVGYDGSVQVFSSNIFFQIDSTVSSGSVPQEIQLVTGTTTANRTSRVDVKHNGQIGFNTTSPDASAAYDMTTTSDLYRGFLQPRMTTTQRDVIPSPAAGLSIYNSTLNYPSTYEGGWVNHAEGLVARVTGIDAKTTGTTNIYTVPTGKTFVVTKIVVRVTAATSITVGATYGFGIAANEDDIVASAVVALTANNTYAVLLPKTGAVIGQSTNVIKIGIDGAATGTSQTLAVDLFGYIL